MLDDKKIIWANYVGEACDSNLFFCFPSQFSKETFFDKRDLDFLVKDISPFYETLINTISDAIEKILPSETPSLVYRILLREPVVLLTYALLDRIIRLNKVIAKNHNLAVGASYLCRPQINMGLSTLIDGSQTYNQYILSRLSASIWNLPVQHYDKKTICDARSAKQVQNLNFDQPSLIRRVNRKISKLISARFGAIPALRLANIDSVLIDHKLYGCGKLKWLNQIDLVDFKSEDLALRGLLVNAISEPVNVAMKDVYSHMGVFDVQMKSHISKMFSELLIEAMPSQRLESANSFCLYENELKKIKPPAIFFCGMPSDSEIFMLAAAQLQGISIIGVQHGAHYGFVEQPCFNELEFAYCDKFVTWGWEKTIKNASNQKVRAVPLPSPWLSVRKNQWSRLVRLDVKNRYARNYDVLFMLDRIQVYPTTVNTLRLSRVDFLSQMNNSCAKNFSQLIDRDIRVLVKPFNYTSRDAQGDLLDYFVSTFPRNFSEYKRLDKGLTKELLEMAWIVIWDEPGTGFFECLLSGIPTMVYWDKLTSKEESHAQPFFSELADVGLLHSDAGRMAEEVSNFLEDPDVWLKNTSRLLAIQRVLDYFSRTDENWSSSWELFLSSFEIESTSKLKASH